jgi:GntR family transcriptional repressor for pyruvate dehydrogenase complex
MRSVSGVSMSRVPQAEKKITIANRADRAAPFAFDQIASAQTLTDRVTEALMRKIAGGDLEAGAKLPSEQMMAASFGVSRTVIREAISRLKSEGLVGSRQGQGAFLRTDRTDVPFRIDINADNPLSSLLHILELRLGLDAEIASLAAIHRRRDQMTAIMRALSDIDTASKEGRDAVEEDLKFHLAIAQATRNPFFFELIQFLGGTFYSAIAVTRANEGRLEALSKQTKAEHEAIAQAIEQRNPEAAAVAARAHIEKASQRLLSADAEFWRSKAVQVLRGPGRLDAPKTARRVKASR